MKVERLKTTLYQNYIFNNSLTKASMKDFLKKWLPEKQIQQLRYLKNMPFKASLETLLSVINILPEKLKIAIKSNLIFKKQLDYDKYSIFLNIDSEMESQLRTNSCKKEPETIEWIEKIFKKGDVFYDIGANVGAYSLVASKFFNDEIKIYAFEPGFHTFVSLCKNISINEISSITPLQIALSDKTSVDTFYYSQLVTGSAMNSVGQPLDCFGNSFIPAFEQPILTYNMDTLIEIFQLPFPTHIKIDVDGVEFGILKGAQKTLERIELQSILVELEDETENSQNIIDFIKNLKFKIHSKHKYVYGGENGMFSNFYNYIFCR